MESRRAFIELYYDGVNISDYIQKDLLSFSYTDNASGYADDVGLDLKDENAKWLNDWFPEKGDKIRAVIKTTNWRKDGDSQSLDCGSFIIDEPTCSGPPSQIGINGNAMPLNSNFKEKRSKTWSNTTLKNIIQSIASRSGLKYVFDSSYNPTIKSVLQDKIGDAEFLMDMCDKYGFACKISDHTIVVFNIEDYENKTPVATIKKTGGAVKDYSLGTTLTNTAYSGVKVKYKDAETGKKQWYSYKPGDKEKEKIFTINEIAEDYNEAEKMALSKYRELNKNEFKGSLTITGNVEILGGTCVVLEEFGKFDGKYFVDVGTHAIGDGFTTSMEIRKIVKKVKPVEIKNPVQKAVIASNKTVSKKVSSRVLITEEDPLQPISRMIIL